MQRWKEEVALASGKKIRVACADHGHNIEVCSGPLKGHMYPHMSRLRDAVREAEVQNAQNT